MPKVADFKIDIDHAKKAIRDLPMTVGVNVYRRGLAGGARIVRDAARAKVPVRYGKLRRAIQVGTTKSSKRVNGVPAEVVAYANVKKGKPKGARYYAHLVEFGTAPHDQPNRKRGPRHHPGSKAQPFMRPAFDETKERVVKAVQESLVKAVDDAVAKLRKRGK